MSSDIELYLAKLKREALWAEAQRESKKSYKTHHPLDLKSRISIPEPQPKLETAIVKEPLSEGNLTVEESLAGYYILGERLAGYCPSVAVVGHHQFKRFKVDGRYIPKCRNCPTMYQIVSGKYVTPLGLAQSWLQDPEQAYLRSDEAQIRYGMSEYSAVEDLGYVYGPPAEDDYTYRPEGEPGGYSIIRKRKGPKPRPGKWDKTGRKFLTVEELERQRSMSKVEAAFHVTEYSKKRQAIRDSIVAEIKSYLERHHIVDDAGLEYLSRLLNAFDGGVIWKAAECHHFRDPRIWERDFFTRRGLDSLAAAATYHYLPLNWTQITGESESIFPDLSRRSLVPYYELVKGFDAGPRRANRPHSGENGGNSSTYPIGVWRGEELEGTSQASP